MFDGWVIGLSFFATYASTNSFVGFSGQTYDWGVPWMLFVPTAVVLCLFAWIVVAPRLRSFTAAMDSLTLPDFIGFRFGSTPARVFAALIVIVASFFYMTAVFKGIGNLLEALPQTTPPNRRLEDPQRTESVLALIHKPGQVQSQVINPDRSSLRSLWCCRGSSGPTPIIGSCVF